MKFLVVLIFSVSISLVAAEGEYYVPRAYYFIDENGRPTIPQPIDGETLNRVRRQVNQGQFQPGYGGFAFPQSVFNFPQPQPGQGSGSFVSTSQTLASRFGEDEPQVSGQTTVIQSSGGQYHQTNTVLRPDGSTQTTHNKGRVKRDVQSQTQAQQNEDGKSQFQSQSQKHPGGHQLQIQSQPGMSQTQSQGASNLEQKGSFDVIEESVVDDNNNNEHHDSPPPTDRTQNFGQQQQPQQGQQQPQQGQQGGFQQGQQQPQQGFPQQQPQQGQQGGFQQGQQQPQQPQGQQQPQQGQQQPQQGQQQPQQGQQGYPDQQGQHNQGQPNYPQQGFPQYPQFPFGGPNFGQPGFYPGNFGFMQPAFGFGFPQQPAFGFQPGQQPAFGGTLDNRFGEDEAPNAVVGGAQTITSQNGVYHATSSILKPDGQVVTTQQSGHNRGTPYHG